MYVAFDNSLLPLKCIYCSSTVLKIQLSKFVLISKENLFHWKNAIIPGRIRQAITGKTIRVRMAWVWDFLNLKSLDNKILLETVLDVLNINTVQHFPIQVEKVTEKLYGRAQHPQFGR